MTTVAGTIVPGSNATNGVPFSNTTLSVLSIDIVPLPTNNGNTNPNIGGAANACLFPLSWTKPAELPLIDLSRLFINASNNTDGAAYIYTTQP